MAPVDPVSAFRDGILLILRGKGYRPRLKLDVVENSLRVRRRRKEVDRAAFCSLLIEAGATSNGKATASEHTASANGSITNADHPDLRDLHIVTVPFTQRRRGVERRLVVEASTPSIARYDQGLIEIVAKAHAFRNALTDGQGRSRQAIADQFGARVEDISRLLPLAFLSPRIVDAILTGRQPVDLTAQRLSRGLDLPIRWDEQETLLGL